MRILFYNHASEISGAERSLLAIMEQARRASDEILLSAPGGALIDAAAKQGFHTVTTAPVMLGYTRNPLVLARYLSAAVTPIRALAGAIRRFQPDLVHANSIRSGLIAVAAVQCVRPRPRVVVHLRDAAREGVLGRLVTCILLWNTDALIAISAYVAKTLQPRQRTVHVLHNAIDLARYQRDPEAGQALRRTLGIPTRAPLLAVVGQITPWKGQREALEALALVRKTYPDAQLLLAGSIKFSGSNRRYNNERYYRRLRERAQRPDLVGFVHFGGEIPHAAAIYTAGDILLVPSWAEPFGRIVIEAMAASCPVIATAAGGIPEIVTHGVDGLLVPARDPSALAQAICTLLADAALRERLVDNGYRTVAARFKIEHYMPRLRQIWQMACVRSRGL